MNRRAGGPHSILALQLKRIGDAVLTAPALAALRLASPEARITLVLAGAAGGLAPCFGMVDEVLVWKPARPNFRLCALLAGATPEVVLDFTGNDRSAFLSLLSCGRRRAGYERFAVNPLRRAAWNVRSSASVRDLHTLDFHAALAAEAGLAVPTVPDSGHLQVPVDRILPDLPDSFALIHPGTARAEKSWPAERWREIALHLIRNWNLPVILTGSDDPDERAHLRKIQDEAGTGKGSGSRLLDLSGKLDLPALAGVISRSRIALGVDTAAMHLASSFRRPQVVLFGPTNPWHWRPRHPEARVLCAGDPEGTGFTARHRAAPMEELSVDRVHAAVDELLSGDR